MIADCSLVSPALRRNELLCLFALQQPILSISESINVYTLFIIVFVSIPNVELVAKGRDFFPVELSNRI